MCLCKLSYFLYSVLMTPINGAEVITWIRRDGVKRVALCTESVRWGCKNEGHSLNLSDHFLVITWKTKCAYFISHFMFFSVGGGIFLWGCNFNCWSSFEMKYFVNKLEKNLHFFFSRLSELLERVSFCTLHCVWILWYSFLTPRENLFAISSLMQEGPAVMEMHNNSCRWVYYPVPLHSPVAQC